MNEYPDTVPIVNLRMPIMFTSATCIYIGLHLAFLLFKYYKKNKDSTVETRLHLAWFSVYLSFSFMFIIYMVSDLFALTREFREQVLHVGYITVGTGGLFFVYNFEKLEFINTKRIITGVLLVLFAILVGLIVHYYITGTWGPAQYFSYSFNIPLFILFSIYVIKIFRKLPWKQKIYTLLIISGLVLFMLGFLMTTDAIIIALGIGTASYLIGQVVMCCSLVIIALFNFKIPTWRELEWRDALRSLFIIYKGGTLLYQHDFKQQDDRKYNAMMIAGALEMIRNILGEVMNSDELETMDIEDKKIMMIQGTHVIIAILVTKNLKSMKYLLRMVLDEFESLFGNVLEKWHGDTDVFEPTVHLIEKIFK